MPYSVFSKGKAWLDYSQFKTLNLSPSYPELPSLTEVNIREVKAFEELDAEPDLCLRAEKE